MSGWEVIGLVLALYPIVETAVKLYGDAKPGRTASSLTRKLKTEAIIYDQFVKNLLEPVVSGPVVSKLLDRTSPDLHETWKDGHLHKELLARLGPIKSTHLLDLLLEMNKRLKALEIELSNISRGTEVLEKFRSRLRAARANAPKGRVQTNLTVVSELNKDLRRLLMSDAISIVHSPTKDGMTDLSYIKFLHRENTDLQELYDIMCNGYACTCHESHLVTVGCHCQSCQEPFGLPKKTSSSWAPELLLWPRGTASLQPELALSSNGTKSVDSDSVEDTETTTNKLRTLSLPGLEEEVSPREVHSKRRSSSISVSPCRDSQQIGKKKVIQDLCATIDEFQREADAAEDILGILEQENKRYTLSINKVQGTDEEANIIRLADLIKINGPAFSTKKRLQIAFQLCLTVLQLCTTPWIDESWTWDECCVVRKIETHPDEGGEEDEDFEVRDEAYHLFVTQQFYSAQLSVKKAKAKRPTTMLNILVGEPTGAVLVKLGCALIELGFGKPMQDIRDEKPPNWLGEVDKNFDPASLDYLTATKLLNSGSVTEELGMDYANVIRACISRQYEDAQQSCVKVFTSGGEKFYDYAEEAIMQPLFDWVKVFC